MPGVIAEYGGDVALYELDAADYRGPALLNLLSIKPQFHQEHKEVLQVRLAH